MSSPYVFTPPKQHTPLPPTTTYYYPYPQPSPFIPNAALYPGSPFASPFYGNTPLPPVSPLPAVSPHFANSPLPDADDSGVKYAVWTDLRPQARKRTLSMNANIPAGGGGLGLYSPYLLSPPVLSPPPLTDRRRSFGYTGAPAPTPLYYTFWGGWEPYFPTYPWPIPPTQFIIHPYLNAQAPRLDFFFDLATTTFSPMRLAGPSKTVLLTANELSELATYPSITSMRIVCDRIPHWPIDLTFKGTGQAPPITVGDVLAVIHAKLQERITHADWAVLSKEQEVAVAKAYTKRCKNAGGARETVERASGVRRVDYLMGKVRFGGLLWVGDGSVKLVVH